MTHFDQHDAALLRALGYEMLHNPASWEDIGTVESGPKLIGGPAHDIWLRKSDDGKEMHIIHVCRGEVDHCTEPAFLWEEDYAGA